MRLANIALVSVLGIGTISCEPSKTEPPIQTATESTDTTPETLLQGKLNGLKETIQRGDFKEIFTQVEKIKSLLRESSQLEKKVEEYGQKLLQEEENTNGFWAQQREIIGRSMFMGGAIAIDVAILSLAMFAVFTNRKRAQNWGAATGVTHTVFPLLTGGIAIAGMQISQIAHHITGGLASVILGYFIYTTIRKNDEEGEEPPDEGLLDNFNTALIAALPVSYDALAGGPAKSFQTEGWNWMEILESAAITGITVSGIAILGAIAGYLIKQSVDKAKLTEGGAEKIGETAEKLGEHLLPVVLGYFALDAGATAIGQNEVSDLTLAALSAGTYLSIKAAGQTRPGEKLLERTDKIAIGLEQIIQLLWRKIKSITD